MSKKPEDNKPQSEKFVEKARELECDEDEAAFEAKLRRIAKQKSSEEKDKTPAR